MPFSNEFGIQNSKLFAHVNHIEFGFLSHLVIIANLCLAHNLQNSIPA